MLIDIYASEKHSKHSLVVPRGMNLDLFLHEVADLIEDLQPLVFARSLHIDDAYDDRQTQSYIRREISFYGAALMHCDVHQELHSQTVA